MGGGDLDRGELKAYYNATLERATTHPEAVEGRTVLIPKSDSPAGPGDFRPITVTSVVTRGLHKILARRVAE